MGTLQNKEEIIQQLYNEMVRDLPEVGSEKQSYFDESTGTWYALTGRTQIDGLNIERAKAYFQDALNRFKQSPPGTSSFQKALYCAIAVEAIEQYLHNNK